MCLASNKNSRFVGTGGGVSNEYGRIEGVDVANGGSRNGRNVSNSSGSITDSSSKMLGAVLTSLVALYVGINRFNMTLYLMEQSSSGASKPIACCGILVVLAIRKVWNDRVGSMVENCSQKVDNVMMRVSSNKTLTRIKSSSMRLLDLATGRHEVGDGCGVTENRRSPQLSIHAAPFVSTEIIAKLSLIDIKNLFRYVVEVNRQGFDRHTFLAEISTWYCREVINVMDRAVMSSRGDSSMPVSATIHESETNPEVRTDQGEVLDASDMDALYFIAVICIFAEWRTLRLVPPVGYHRYSIGMGLAKRDLIQNAHKMECAAQQYIYEHENKYTNLNNASSDVNVNLPVSQSPTIRQLIQWEIDRNVHSNLPKLREKSCASGFIWIYRQVQYQNNIFQNILHIPDTYPTSKAAVSAAYRSTYDDYHGFFIKNIFLSSFEAAPSHEEILLHMNPHTHTPCPTPITTERIVQKNTPVSTVTAITQPQRNPWELVTNHFVREWMKLERFMNQCHGQQNEYNDYRNGLIIPQKDCSTLDLTRYAAVIDKQVDVIDDDIQCTSAVRAASDICEFSTILQPILSQLHALIDQLNINDPSKC